MTSDTDRKRTPLHALHAALGAKFVPFAGYDMPVQYPLGVMKEHQHTREAAGLFDVSHMGQVELIGRDHAHVAAALEALVPADLLSLQPGQMRYTMLLNAEGGILDDLIVTRQRTDGRLGIVVNAACKDADVAHMREALPDDISVRVHEDKALLALQGPKAVDILSRHSEGPGLLTFMEAGTFEINSVTCGVSRSGYTGEDGFEIALDGAAAAGIAETLLADDEVEPIGLGARDSLRLEAGLCLYGHDMDETVTPIEAGLAWSIGKRRRTDGGFPGAHVILEQLRSGTPRKRVGLRPEGRMPVREGAKVLDASGAPIGTVTSGGFGPSLGAPCAMALVDIAHSKAGTAVGMEVRGKVIPGVVTAMPFVPHRYKR